jgi:hypothetical protein
MDVVAPNLASTMEITCRAPEVQAIIMTNSHSKELQHFSLPCPSEAVSN